MKMKRGTQIIYIPAHASGNVKHEDCERGFVITDKGESVFCRYWTRTRPELRTVANSESTPKAMLIVSDTVHQRVVDMWIKEIEQNPEIYGHVPPEENTT